MSIISIQIIWRLSSTFQDVIFLINNDYQATSNGYKVRREIHDTTPAGLCSVDYVTAWNDEAKTIAENLQQQVFYQRKPRTK